MAATPEGKVKRGVKEFLKELGCWYYMPVQNGMGAVGVPDFIACVRGRLIGIECKAPGREYNVTPNQLHQLKGITAAGGIALVVTDVAQLRTALRMLT